jgi:hypothetical protein
MRYKVIAKQYKSPGHLLVRLQDGRVLRDAPQRLGLHLKVGDTGVAVQGRNRTHFKPDAIDLDYASV